MSDQHQSVAVPLTLLAAATGARSMMGLAAVGRAAGGGIAGATAGMAAFELVGDKIPSAPDRIDAGPIVGRMISGAIVGAAVARRTDRDVVATALAGAAIAFVGAHLTFRLRKKLMDVMPPVTAALVEDAIILAAVGMATAALDDG